MKIFIVICLVDLCLFIVLFASLDDTCKCSIVQIAFWVNWSTLKYLVELENNQDRLAFHSFFKFQIQSRIQNEIKNTVQRLDKIILLDLFSSCLLFPLFSRFFNSSYFLFCKSFFWSAFANKGFT